MISTDVKAFEVGVNVFGLQLDFSFVVALLVGTAVGFVKGVMLEETAEGVSVCVVFEFGLTVDVGVKVGVTTLVVIVDLTIDVTVCVVCIEVVVSDVENLVGGCDTVDVPVVGVTALVDMESGRLVVKNVVIGGIIEVTLDVDALDLVDRGGPVVVTPEFDTDDAVAVGAIGDVEVVTETLGEDAVCTVVSVVSVI